MGTRKTPKWVKRAMNLAIRRARFEQAGISLDPNDPFSNDTDAVREATKLYVETWLVSLLRAVRDGDRSTARDICSMENCSDPDGDQK